MILWLDAQLSPALAAWISQCFELQAVAIRDLGLHRATDEEIFIAARSVEAIVVTKD
jgi:predicted nuclease of predicted toxin-antitoxin system